MLRYEQKYMIRKELVENFILAFYKLLWNKEDELSSKLNLVVLSGDHMEEAFIEVRSESECLKEHISPLIPNISKTDNISVFVNHIDIIKVRRRQLSEFFSNRMNHSQEEVDLERMYNRMIHHGNAYLNIFGLFSAKGLPFYSIILA